MIKEDHFLRAPQGVWPSLPRHRYRPNRWIAPTLQTQPTPPKTTPLAATTPYLSKSKVESTSIAFAIVVVSVPRQGRRNNIVRFLAVNQRFRIFLDPKPGRFGTLRYRTFTRDAQPKRWTSPTDSKPSAGKHRQCGNKRKFEKNEEKGLSGTSDGPQFKHLGESRHANLYFSTTDFSVTTGVLQGSASKIFSTRVVRPASRGSFPRRSPKRIREVARSVQGRGTDPPEFFLLRLSPIGRLALWRQELRLVSPIAVLYLGSWRVRG